jgi:cytochrome c556
MTASSLLRSPDAHVGENVSMMATIETVLSKTAFTVDQDRTKSTGQEVLVLVPALATAPERNTYVTIEGEVMKFDPAEIAKKAPAYTLDLPADVIAKFRGKPVVLATVVVTTNLVDLAKKPITPMTTEELAFKSYMTTINLAAPAVRAGTDAASIKDQVAALKKSFTDVNAYFKTHGPAGALKLSDDALALATAMDTSLTAGKLDDVKASATTLSGMCATCHGQFRERLDDGSYRIKSGG